MKINLDELEQEAQRCANLYRDVDMEPRQVLDLVSLIRRQEKALAEVRAERREESSGLRVAIVDERAAGEDAVDLLRELEWSGTNQYSESVCPECRAEPHEGHDADCKLAALIAQPVVEGIAQADGPDFAVDDPDLNQLLNLASDLAKGRCNMGTGIMWLEYLDRVQSRLAAPTAQPTPPGALQRMANAGFDVAYGGAKVVAQPTPPDDERALRATFEKWAGIKYRHAIKYGETEYQLGWAAWKEASSRAALRHPPVPNVDKLTDARILEIAAEQDYGDEDPKCITRLARALESEIHAAQPTQAGAEPEPVVEFDGYDGDTCAPLFRILDRKALKAGMRLYAVRKK